METLTAWSVARSGAWMTITHSTGKIVGIVSIEPQDGATVATHDDGRKFVLSV